MARPLTPASADDVKRVRMALVQLKSARALLSGAWQVRPLANDGPLAPQALAKVQAAIKSTEGALRHVQRRADATAARDLPVEDAGPFYIRVETIDGELHRTADIPIKAEARAKLQSIREGGFYRGEKVKSVEMVRCDGMAFPKPGLRYDTGLMTPAFSATAAR